MNKLNTIYKVNLVSDNNTLNSIIVFYGKSDIDKVELTELFKTDPNNEKFLDKYTGNPIFTSEELDFIKKNNSEVSFSNHQIHLDDTILSVKLKILIETQKDIAMEEMFLFCIKNETITPTEFYKILTQNKRVVLTKERLENALQNFKSTDVFSPLIPSLDSDKEYYSYDDILSIDIFNKEIKTINMLGQKLFIIDNHYPFSYNPFDIKNYDKILFSATANAITTMNNNLILDNGNFINNNIYIAFASDVLSIIPKRNPLLNEQFLINVYFPLLNNHNVTTIEQLNQTREEIKKDTIKLLSEATENTFKKEDLLYSISNPTLQSDNQTFQYESQGMVEIKFAIQQRFTLNVPLDLIFKIISASPIIPFIKLNPSPHRENNYKLYGNDRTKDNRIIPILTKTKTLQLMNGLGRSKGVSLFFNLETNDNIELICEFSENGDTIVHIKSLSPLTFVQVNDITLKYINPNMKQLSDFFLQSGYNFTLFDGIYENNIEIIQINYGFDIELQDNAPEINIKSIQNCITPIFITNSTNINSKTGINMRYRKVSNFNKMSSKEAFIIEQVKRRDGYQGEMLVESLMDAHSLNEDEARELIATVAAQLTIETGGIGAKTSRIRSNPGFVTNIMDIAKKSLKMKRKIRILIQGIDNIYYIQVISIYIDSILRLMFNNDDVLTIYPNLKDICSLSQNENIKKNDLLSVSEQNILNKEEIIVNDEGVNVITDIQPVNIGDANIGEPIISALDLIYGENDDDADYGDYEGYSDYEDEPIQDGGNDSTDNKIIGLRLTKPNPFVKIMEEADKELILTKSDGKYSGYSTNCDSAYGRQPIIMTKEEYDDAVKKERDFIINRYGEDDFWLLSEDEQEDYLHQETQLDDRFVITYGTTSNKQHVYACPRYWCMKTNSYIHPNELTQKRNPNGTPMVDSKGNPMMEHPTCGGVIPRGQDKIKDDGNFVYEFTGENRRSKKDGKYLANYPGFLPRDKHPQGKCLPCCFKFSDAKGKLMHSKDQIAKRKDCTGNIEENVDTIKTTKSDIKGDPLYIVDQGTAPVPKERWGFLPIEVQYFAKDYSNKYLGNDTGMQIKLDTLTILRHGIDMKNQYQGFLSAMADVMFYNSPTDKRNLSDFKKYLLSKLSLERFVRYQNGNLVKEFYTNISLDKIDVSKYTSSPLYIKTSHDHFVKLIRSYENFIAFIILDDTYIDHTYMWDLICDKDIHESHPTGINLVILNIPNDDITTKVDVICPTNHYSSVLFNMDRPTVILIKRENLYEPVYSLKRTNTNITFQKYFSDTPSEIPAISLELNPSTIMTMLHKVINPIYQKKCSPLQSMRNEYKFRQAILLTNLQQELNNNKDVDVEIKKQILNYSYKTIGLLVKIGELQGVIPCYPSAPITKTPIENVFMDEEGLYSDYNTTIQFMNKVINHFGNKIPIQPKFKIVDDEVVVGVITITNQMVLLSQPIALSSTNDDIQIIRHKGYVSNKSNNNSFIDSIVTNDKSIDNERIEYVNKVKLETNFFNAFRNTVRVLINDFTNLNIRIEIEKEIENNFILYETKLESVVDKIKTLVSSHIQFSEEIDTTSIKNVSLCINSTTSKCNENNPICMISDDENTCVLVLPKFNLVSPEVNNEVIYLNKLADQLIRYTHIRGYMMDTSQFLNIGEVRFELSDNEIVVPHSILKSQYFENLRAHKSSVNKSINTYDETNPTYMTMKYPKEFSYNDVLNIDLSENKTVPAQKEIKHKKKLLVKKPKKLDMPTQKLEEDIEENNT